MTGKIERIREIVEILFEHGLMDFIKELGFISFVSRKRFEENIEKRVEEVKAEDLRLLFEDLGPAFVKLGQFLSLRPDLVPIEFAHELRLLYEQATPFSSKRAKAIIERELGCKLDDLFDEFYNTPLAAASIGQVHEAVLKTGEEVVVKVQRPDIRKRVEADMYLIGKIAGIIEDIFPESEIYHPQDTVNEFKKMLEKELDYTIEARNAQRFHDAFYEDPDVIIPRIHWEYVTSKVMVMDHIEGKSIRHAIDTDLPEEEKKLLAEKYAQTMMKQFLIHGIFHADPSPGNIYYTKNDKIVLLDFGAIGWLPESRRNKLIDMFIAMIKGDPAKVREILLDISGFKGDIDLEQLELDIENILDLYKHKKDVMFKEGANQEIMMIAMNYNITLPANFILMERALIETEGVCKALDPDFDFFDASEPVIKEVIRIRYGPKAQAMKMADTVQGYHKLATELPHKLNRILEGFEERDFAVTIEHKGLQELEDTLELISNRLSFTIISAAIIIGSALIVLSAEQPLFGPYIFMVSVLIGIWLLAIIVKRGRY